jgi:hypothetical protein
MTDVDAYIKDLKATIIQRDPNQPEFQEAVFAVLESVKPVLKKHPEYVKNNVLGLSLNQNEFSNSVSLGKMIKENSMLTVVSGSNSIRLSDLTRVA